MKNILITGAAGFIGYNLTKNLIENKEIKVLNSAKLIYQTKIVLMTYKDQILIALSTLQQELV